MRTKMKFKVISFAVCASMVLGLTGCQKTALMNFPETSVAADKVAEKISTISSAVSTVESENTDVQAIYPDEVYQEDKDDGTDYLNVYMSYFTDSVIGVCYLGYREKDSTVPLADWIQASKPELVEKFPFILKITEDKDRVVGDGYGDLFCFVPKDYYTTLSVDHVTWKSDGAGVWPVADDVLYRNEYAEPILVFSNYEQFWDETNVMISALSGSGGYVQWCPYLNLDNNGSLDIPSFYKEDYYAGTYEAKLLVDFTDIATNTELKDPYHWNAWDYIKAIDPYDLMDDSWSPVYDTTLMNTKWQCYEDWYIFFGEGNCDPSYSGYVEIYQKTEQSQDYQMMYSGVWRMDNEYLYMETVSMSGTETTGGSFLMLVAPSGEEMDMYMDYSTGVIPPFFVEGVGFATLKYRYE